MLSDHDRILLIDAHSPLENECVYVHKPQLMRALHDQCRRNNVHKPRQMQVMRDQCCMAYSALRWPTFLSHSTFSLADGAYNCTTMMSANICAHDTTNACKPWIMLLVIGRRRLLDANMPRLMHGPLGVFDSMARTLTC